MSWIDLERQINGSEIICDLLLQEIVGLDHEAKGIHIVCRDNTWMRVQFSRNLTNTRTLN